MFADRRLLLSIIFIFCIASPAVGQKDGIFQGRHFFQFSCEELADTFLVDKQKGNSRLLGPVKVNRKMAFFKFEMDLFRVFKFSLG